jgi:hypothetical protein
MSYSVAYIPYSGSYVVMGYEERKFTFLMTRENGTKCSRDFLQQSHPNAVIHTDHVLKMHVILVPFTKNDAVLVPGETKERKTYHVLKPQIGALWRLCMEYSDGIYQPPLSDHSHTVLNVLKAEAPVLLKKLGVTWPRDAVRALETRVEELFRTHRFHREKIPVEGAADGAGAQPMAALILPVVEEAQPVVQAVKPEPAGDQVKLAVVQTEPAEDDSKHESEVLKKRRIAKQTKAAAFLQTRLRRCKLDKDIDQDQLFQALEEVVAEEIVSMVKKCQTEAKMKQAVEALVKTAVAAVAEDETMRGTLHSEIIPALLAALPQLPAAQGPAKRQKTDEVIILDD